jgi:hypothetical protein
VVKTAQTPVIAGSILLRSGLPIGTGMHASSPANIGMISSISAAPLSVLDLDVIVLSSNPFVQAALGMGPEWTCLGQWA